MSNSILSCWVSASGLSKKAIQRETGINNSSLNSYLSMELKPSTKTVHSLLSLLIKNGVELTFESYYESIEGYCVNAKIILSYCSRNDMKISEFSYLMGFGSSLVSSWINGDSCPTEFQKEKIINILKSDEFLKMETLNCCERCSKNVIRSGFKFCPSCGFEIGSQSKCDSCMSILNPSSKFCHVCGNKTARAKKIIHTIDSASIPVPKNGITLEFRFSQSANFSYVLSVAREFSSFREFGSGKNTFYRVSVGDNQLLDLSGLSSALRFFRNKKLYINGVEEPWEKTGHVLHCCEMKKSSSSKYYCFGIDSYREISPFGCIQTNFSLHRYITWGKWGKWLNKDGDWVFDKERIIEQLKKDLSDYKICPYINNSLISEVINQIPDVVNPYKDSDWEFLTSYLEDDYDDELGVSILVEDKDYFGGKIKRKALGVKPKGKKFLRKVIRNVYKDEELIMWVDKLD